jgi:hypothetical protein
MNSRSRRPTAKEPLLALGEREKALWTGMRLPKLPRVRRNRPTCFVSAK